MSLGARVRSATRAMFGRASSAIAVIPRWMVGHPTQMPDEALDFPWAFKLIPDVYACVTLIQNEVASLPLCFYREGRDGERVELEPSGDRVLGNVADLWRRANNHETGYNIIEQITGSLLIWGNAYLYLETFGASRPRELHVLSPQRMLPVLALDGSADHYLLDVGVGSRKPLPAESVVWIKGYDPFGTGLGLSPLEAARLTYETQRDMARGLRAFHKRGGVAPGYYVTDSDIEESERKEILKEMKKQLGDPESAVTDPVILAGTLRFERAGLTQSEMQFLEIAARTTEDILRIYHVPPIVYGIHSKGALGSEGADTEELRFYQQCIKPWTRRIASALGEFLLPRFGQDLVCDFDFSGVLAYQDVFQAQAQAYVQATGAPILTVAEARKRLGLPVEPEDGELLVPFNLLPESEANQPPPAAAAPGEPAPTPADETAKKQARDRMRALAARDLSRHERAFRRGLPAFFTHQEQRVVERVREQATRAYERVVDVDRLLDDSDSDRQRLRQLIRAVVEERGQETVDELAAEVAFASFNERVDRYVQEKAFTLAKNVNATTRAALRETLTQGIAADETGNELVARVRDVYVERRTGGAALIARTESAAAYNFATVEAWDQSGVVATKQWLTAQDDAVREAHADLDGVEVPLDDVFTLTDPQGGVYHADFPGDPALPASLVCNCRCTLVPGTALGSRGAKRASDGSCNGHVTIEELLNVR